MLFSFISPLCKFNPVIFLPYLFWTISAIWNNNLRRWLIWLEENITPLHSSSTSCFGMPLLIFPMNRPVHSSSISKKGHKVGATYKLTRQRNIRLLKAEPAPKVAVSLHSHKTKDGKTYPELTHFVPAFSLVASVFYLSARVFLSRGW